MKSEKKKYVSAFILLLVMVAVGMVCSPVFYLNDDVTMRSILSGAYTGTPDGHAVYMQYPLTGLLALLYRVIPALPWLELCFGGCIWICMCLVADEFENKLLGGILGAVVCLPFYVYMHYTIVAALAAGCGVLLLSEGRKRGWAWFLLWMAYMIRSQVGLLALPFVAASLVWRFLQADTDNRKQALLDCLKQAGVLALGLLIIAGIHHACYSSEGWKSYLRYNESRTQLYDYTDFLSTHKYAEAYEAYGMSLEEYELLSSYNTMLDNEIDSQRMQEIADKVTEGMRGTSPGWKDVLKSYYLQVRYNDFPYNMLWIAAYLVLGICLLGKRRWLQLIFLSILGVGRSSVWMYLIAQGRFPERVSLSLYIIELLLLLGLGIGPVRERKPQWKRISPRVVSVGVMVLLVALGIYLAVDAREKVAARTEVQTGWNLLKDYCEEHDENTYLMDVFSSVSYADRLYTQDAPNLMILGGWLTASPLTEERLNNLGGRDGGEVLYYQKTARLVTDRDADVAGIESYLRERFGECSLVKVDALSWRGGSFYIYEVQ